MAKLERGFLEIQNPLDALQYGRQENLVLEESLYCSSHGNDSCSEVEDRTGARTLGTEAGRSHFQISMCRSRPRAPW